MAKAKAASPQAGRFPNSPVNPDDATRQRNVDRRANHSGRSSMTKHLLNCSVHVAAAAALCLGAMINDATTGSFTRGCAARDLQILMLIEERESANAISAEKLNDAMV